MLVSARAPAPCARSGAGAPRPFGADLRPYAGAAQNPAPVILATGSAGQRVTAKAPVCPARRAREPRALRAGAAPRPEGRLGAASHGRSFRLARRQPSV